MTWARRGLTALLASLAVVMLGPAYSWAATETFTPAPGNTHTYTITSDDLPTAWTAGFTATLALSGGGGGTAGTTWWVQTAHYCDGSSTPAGVSDWFGPSSGTSTTLQVTWPAPPTCTPTHWVVLGGTEASGANDAYALAVPAPSASPSPTPSPSPAEPSPEPSPSTTPGPATPAQDLVCEEQGCTMRLDGTQYLVVMTALALIVMLLVTNLVRSEAVPILRG